MRYLRFGIMIFMGCFMHVNLAFAVSDQEINMNIIYQLARDPDTLTTNIEVLTHDGIVSLRGEVPTLRQALAIIEVAASTTGVKQVVTRRLTLPYGRPLPLDDVILAKIRGSMRREGIDSDCVCIDVQNQIVYVSENLCNAEEKYRLRRTIQAVPEVKTIRYETITWSAPPHRRSLFKA